MFRIYGLDVIILCEVNDKLYLSYTDKKKCGRLTDHVPAFMGFIIYHYILTVLKMLNVTQIQIYHLQNRH